MFCTVPRAIKGIPYPVGAIQVITESGEWECPATGSWQVEIHGGGGGGAYAVESSTYYRVGGSGSGEIYTADYTEGAVISVTIGTGGAGKTSSTSSSASASDGGSTTFGELSVFGGGGGIIISGSLYIGESSGSIATNGAATTGSAIGGANRGYGNKDKTSQPYGNGGYVSSNAAGSGENGAVILTYLGT